MAGLTDTLAPALYDATNYDVMPKYVPPGHNVFLLENLMNIDIPDPETDLLSALHFAYRLHVLASSDCEAMLNAADISQWCSENLILIDSSTISRMNQFVSKYFLRSLKGCWGSICIPEYTEKDIGWSSGTLFFIAWAGIYTFTKLIPLATKNIPIYTRHGTLAISDVEVSVVDVYWRHGVAVPPIWHWPAIPFNLYSQFQITTQVRHLAVRWDYINTSDPALCECLDKLIFTCAHMCAITYDANNQYVIDMDESYASNSQNMGLQETEIGEDYSIDVNGKIVDNNKHRVAERVSMSNRFVYENVTLLMNMKFGLSLYDDIVYPATCSVSDFFIFAKEIFSSQEKFSFTDDFDTFAHTFSSHRKFVMQTCPDFDKLCVDRIIVGLMPPNYRELFCYKNYWIMLKNDLYVNAEMTPDTQYGTRTHLLRTRKVVTFSMNLFPIRIQLDILSQCLKAMTVMFDSETPLWIDKFYIPEAKSCYATGGDFAFKKILKEREDPFVITIGGKVWVYTSIERFVECSNIDEVFIIWCLSYIQTKDSADVYVRLIRKLFCTKIVHTTFDQNVPESIRRFLANADFHK